jgi:choline dehydrogenase-like flavoprotein
MRIAVIGAGVCGSHAALTLLECGHEVELWDVGREEKPFPEPSATFQELKGCLADSVAYLLGPELEALIPPTGPELLRYPPSRDFLTPRQDLLWSFLCDEFLPYAAHVRGGLANGWGANALSFDDSDVTDWPVSFSDMEAAYRTAYRRVPVAGPIDDDLSPYLTGTYPSQPPVRLSGCDERLLRTYKQRRRKLATLGVRIGQARLAVVTDPQRDDACNHCDRCLWGCPRGSIYNPSQSTLRACQARKGFRYLPGRFVLSLLSHDNRITGIRYLNTATQEISQEACDVVFLAAGALETGSIFLRTLKQARPEIPPETEGLMDTTVIKLPFVALGSIGLPSDRRSFQFNRLILGLISDSSVWPRYLHGEVLHLTSLIYHPLIERMPFDSRLSKRLFFALRSALGAVSLFFPDRIVKGNRQVLVDEGGRWEKIQLHYRETQEKERYIRQSVSKIRSALWRLGCLPKGFIPSPLGGGIHYAGTVPMGSGPRRCDATGRSNLFSNLYIADGAAFPSLPSKPITMSLAAHATRVALGAGL